MAKHDGPVLPSFSGPGLCLRKRGSGGACQWAEGSKRLTATNEAFNGEEPFFSIGDVSSQCKFPLGVAPTRLGSGSHDVCWNA